MITFWGEYRYYSDLVIKRERHLTNTTKASFFQSGIPLAPTHDFITALVQWTLTLTQCICKEVLKMAVIIHNDIFVSGKTEGHKLRLRSKVKSKETTIKG